jgi:hypothetical protein
MLEGMEASGKVNLDIVELFGSLIGIARRQEAEWEKNRKDISRSESFAVYHLWRNTRLILTKVKERFQEASARHENPTVVLQAIQLLPALTTTFGMLSSTVEFDNRFYAQARILRSVASKLDMLPDLQQEIADTDSIALKSGIAKFSEALRAELLEE